MEASAAGRRGEVNEARLGFLSGHDAVFFCLLVVLDRWGRRWMWPCGLC
jgi:hypothetical protein